MTFSAIPMSERTKKIRQYYLQMPVAMAENPFQHPVYRAFATGDRWMTLGYLRGWQKHFDAETSRLRTSYAEAEELYQAQPVITPDELLVGQLYLPEYSPEELEEYEKLCEMFQMSAHTLTPRPPRKDHLSLDFDKLLTLGVEGIMDEIRKSMASLNLADAKVFPDYEVIKQHEFYRCLLIELEALLDLAGRYSKKAYEMAQTAEEPRKSELLRISKIMEKVPAKPAETFYEAIQSVQFFLSNLFGLYPLNRPDRYLYRYYVQDIQSGTLSPEFAQELIDNFCLHISTRVFSTAACGFIVGGQDAEGNLVENDLTYMFLTALDHLQLADPNGALAVNEKTSNEILHYCAQILAKGTTHPAFYNDNAIISSLEHNYGCTHEDAVNYIHTTCAEISVVGKTRSFTTPITIGLPDLLLDIVHEKLEFESFEQLTECYLERVKSFFNKMIFRYFTRMMEVSRVGNESMRVCALVDDCIARGKSLYEGGARYTFVQPIFIGFATAVDSLHAIKTLVFEQKRLTLSEFDRIVRDNFEGQEQLRQYIICKIPHYGNDNQEVDALAASLAKRIISLCEEEGILGSDVMMPGTFSYISHAQHGANAGATFDGRLKGVSYSDGCGPAQGRDTNGPTAMINSLTSWEQSKLLGGMVVNIKFGENHLNDGNLDIFTGMVKTFIQQGGLEMQVNVVDRETLEDARIHPEQHQDLLVRIGGYSDYFVRLTPTMQQEVIDRTQY